MIYHYDYKAMLEEKLSEQSAKKSRDALRDEEQQQSRMQARIYRYKKKKEQEMTEKEKNGIYTSKMPQNTPDWIICNIGIKPDELPEPNEKGYINIDICRSKDGYYYARLNDWKPEKKEEENIVKFNDGTDEVPF